MTDQVVQLSAEQQHVLTVVESGANVFITGPGGTGKSTVIREIENRLDEKRRKYFLTAPTGIAALNIGGSTLHSFCGAGLAEGSKEDCLKEVMVRKKNVGWWQQCQVLIIDEVSMLDPEFFEKLDFIAKGVRKSDDFFGGIQIVAVGDFYQLPPVKPDRGNQTGNKMEFVFEHPLWKVHMTRCIQLCQVHRQKDLEFVRLLSEIRNGSLSEAGSKLLRSRIDAEIPCPDGIQPTRLFPTRAEADRANKTELEALPGKVSTFYRKQSCQGFLTAAMKTYYYKKLDENCQADIELKLKVGSQVMLLVNLSVEDELANGSRGVILNFDDETGWPVVRFANDHTELIKPFVWTQVSPDKKWVISHSQVPLKLAYGITIHKSQSLSIDLLSVCLSKVFEFGQSYVALSRARTLAGLRLEGDFDPDRMAPHPKVVTYYNSLSKLVAAPEKEIVTSTKRGRKSGSKSKAKPTTVIRVPIRKILQNYAPKPEPPISDDKAAKTECVICLDKLPTHVLTPCGHKCICGDCSDQVSECPLCRVSIEQLIRVFE
jgi:ATP-dependent DNA helicase PIF1